MKMQFQRSGGVASRRFVRGPFGTIDIGTLPGSPAGRWGIRRKAELHAAIVSRILSFDEASLRYALSRTELGAWHTLIKSGGFPALGSSKTQIESVGAGSAARMIEEAWPSDSVESFGNLTLDYTHQKALAHGVQLALTNLQYSILELLALCAGYVVTRAMLLDYLYGTVGNGEPEMKIIDVEVCRMRAQIAKKTGAAYIRTVWGRGYLFMTPSA